MRHLCLAAFAALILSGAAFGQSDKVIMSPVNGGSDTFFGFETLNADGTFSLTGTISAGGYVSQIRDPEHQITPDGRRGYGHTWIDGNGVHHALWAWREANSDIWTCHYEVYEIDPIHGIIDIVDIWMIS